MKKETIALTATPRTPAERMTVLRKSGQVPGIVYGQKMKNATIKCSAKELRAVYVKAGENTLVELLLESKKLPCLIHAVSFDPVSDMLDHVDFYAVDMTKKVTTHVPVVFTGESLAVKTQGGVLVTVHSQLEVTCLPSDLPESFVVDISTLDNLRDTVTVADIKAPSGVVIKSTPETVILIVQEPRKEEVIAPVVTAVTEGAIPVEGAVPGAPAPAASGTPGAAPAAGAPAAKAEDKAGGKEKKK